MIKPLPSHTDLVKSLIAQVDTDSDALLKLGMSVFGKSGEPMYPLDHLAVGAVKRNISTARAFNMLIESWNMVCARTLLRVHIDTSLRFSAAWLVDKPHDFATRVLKGERIDKLKDRDGKSLSDAYIVEVRSSEHPWLQAVYKNLSGYVHFSGLHIYASVVSISEKDRTISFEISDTDLQFPEASWVEILRCFRDATGILTKFLNGYISTKQLSPAELAAAKQLLARLSVGEPSATS